MEENYINLKYLLNNFWCVKELEPEKYYYIKNNLDSCKDFIKEKLGSKLIVNDKFIKLEKTPSSPKSYMGLNDFNRNIEYVILMIILLFLEDKPKQEQFILSNLIDYISQTARLLELNNIPNWDLLKDRKSLQNVIYYLKDKGIIKVVEESSSFTENKNAEGLYETTGISNYFVREFNENIQEYNNLKDFVIDEFNNQDINIKDIRRFRVYRHIIYALSTYTKDLSESEIDYLRKMKNNMQTEIEKYLPSSLEVTKNMALLLTESDYKEKLDFPNAKAVSDIVLLVNNEILNELNDEKINLNDEEFIYVSKEIIERIIKNVYKEFNSYFSKKYKDLTKDDFVTEVINYMKEYDFIFIEDNNYRINPSVSKFIGFINKEDKEQLSIFESEVE